MSERDNDSDDSGGSGRPGFPIDLLRLWLAVRQRWHYIVVAGVLGAFIGAAWAKKLTDQTFRANAILSWEPDATADETQRATIVESITLPSNLEEVAKQMKLAVPPRILFASLEISASEHSNHVGITSTWSSAEGAAELANTVSKVFLDARERSIKNRGLANVERYREAVAKATKNHEDAVAAYDAFRKAAGFNDISAERESAITQYAELMAQTDVAKAEAESARTQLDALKGEADKPARQPTPLLEVDLKQAQADSARLPEVRRELEGAKRQYNDDHPNVRRLTAELEAIEARVRAQSSDPSRRRERVAAAARRAEARQHQAEEFQAQLKQRLNKLSEVEGKAAVLLGELKLSEEALERSKQLLTAAEFDASQPRLDIRLQEAAKPPQVAESSPRKRIAITFPVAFAVLSLVLIIVWSFRKLDVRTPKEAAFWSGVPVIGASTWPRDPDMLPALMHDLDDYAPQAEGVTLIVGLSMAEAHLARKVAEWDGSRGSMRGTIDDPARLLMVGKGGSMHPLAVANSNPPPSGPQSVREPTGSNMQILTLSGPVPAQALRRAARLADRVVVVVSSGKHSIFQMLKIQNRLGREEGIGVLLVGLDKDYALVRDRVGDVANFWTARRLAT